MSRRLLRRTQVLSLVTVAYAGFGAVSAAPAEVPPVRVAAVAEWPAWPAPDAAPWPDPDAWICGPWT